MTVKTPGRRAGSGIALRQVKRNMQTKTARSLSAALNLTSMVDFMSVIVIFLLMSFSADGDLSQNAPDITPPEASAADQLKRLPIIAVSATEITLEGVRVESSRTVLAEDDNYELPKLAEALKREQDNFKAIRKGEEFKGEIIIQADEDVPYKLIRRVFGATARAGYGNIAYMVRMGAPE
jgi:biopolymer transport protein ExbD